MKVALQNDDLRTTQGVWTCAKVCVCPCCACMCTAASGMGSPSV